MDWMRYLYTIAQGHSSPRFRQLKRWTDGQICKELSQFRVVTEKERQVILQAELHLRTYTIIDEQVSLRRLRCNSD